MTPALGLLPRREEGRVDDVAAAPLVVEVHIRFLDPGLGGSAYNRKYASSRGFQPTDRICRGLVRRIDHCCEEFITRKDSGALVAVPPRTLRYEMTFHIFTRDGSTTVDRTFRSYQKQELTVESAREVVNSTHRIVGLFLKTHDKAFRWAEEPLRVHYSTTQDVEEEAAADPVSLCCVPRSLFIESSQSFESLPGFNIELSFRSRSRSRSQYEWKRFLRLSSRQNSPLNLAMAEEMMWKASRAVNTALDLRSDAFYKDHEGCEWLEGVVRCQHFDVDALDVDLRIVNSFGPKHSHLQRTVRSRLGLFRHPDGMDCQDFIRDIQMQLSQLRDAADDRLTKMNDLDLRIVALQGRGWKVDNPARFSLASTMTSSRRTIAAALARVQTGISDILRGNDVAIHIAAYKRGHLVLDKAIVAHVKAGRIAERFVTPDAQKEAFVSRLKARIQQDLDMISMDTCSLDGIPEELHDTESIISAPHQEASSLQENKRDSLAELPAVEAPPSRASSRASSTKPRVFPLVPAKYTAPDDSGPADSDEGPDGSEEIAADPTVETCETGSDETPLTVIRDEDAARQLVITPVPSELGDEEVSSQPSTPGLSSTADTSPRNSVIVTPAMLRTQSGAPLNIAARPEISDGSSEHSIIDRHEDAVEVGSLAEGKAEEKHDLTSSYPFPVDQPSCSQVDEIYQEDESENGDDTPRAEIANCDDCMEQSTSGPKFEEEFSRTKPELVIDEEAELPAMKASSGCEEEHSDAEEDELRDSRQLNADLDTDRLPQDTETFETEDSLQPTDQSPAGVEQQQQQQAPQLGDQSGADPEEVVLSRLIPIDDSPSGAEATTPDTQAPETSCEETIHQHEEETPGPAAAQLPCYASDGPDVQEALSKPPSRPASRAQEGFSLPSESGKENVPESYGTNRLGEEERDDYEAEVEPAAATTITTTTPIAELDTEPLAEPVAELVAEPVAEPVVGEAACEPVSEPVAGELVAEPAAGGPASEPTGEPDAEPVTEPVAADGPLLKMPEPLSTTPEPGPGQVLKDAGWSNFAEALRRSLTPPALLVPSNRTSVSSGWEDYPSQTSDTDGGGANCGDITRDSVETFRDDDEDLEDQLPPMPARRRSIPTAGYFGFFENKLAEMGLLGPFGGSYRNDAANASVNTAAASGSASTSQQPPELDAQSAGTATPKAPKSPTLSPPPPRLHKRAKSASARSILMFPSRNKRRSRSAEAKDREADPEADKGKENEYDGVLPRVIMMFAGMAVASQMINKSS